MTQGSPDFVELLDVMDPERKKRKMVQAKVRVPEVVRERWNEVTHKFFGSTCESLTAFVFGMDQAEKGISSVTAINPSINLAFYTLVLNPRRVRRKIRIAIDEEVYESWERKGSPERCLVCGSRFRVESYVLPTKDGSVYLCPNCAKNELGRKFPVFSGLGS